MLSDENKYLVLKKDVLINDNLDKVINRLDPLFKDNPSFVTSGIRTPEKQLQVIQDLCVTYKIQDDSIGTASVDTMITFQGESVYSWQLAWSKLLNIGILVNPPVRAKVLLDYIREGINKKGRSIPPSVHFYGRAFDIGGGKDSITDELRIIDQAMKSGKFPEILSYTVERKQNCLHVNIVA